MTIDKQMIDKQNFKGEAYQYQRTYTIFLYLHILECVFYYFMNGEITDPLKHDYAAN